MLSVIIPVYNEEKTVSLIIEKVKRVKIQKEIIVIDDASTDASFNILQKVTGIKLLKHKKNLGKGAAIKTGLERAIGEIIIVQDADLEYDPSCYPELIKPILNKKTSVVYGNRLENYPIKLFGKNQTPFLLHYIGNKFLSFITRVLFSSQITDMETGYKVFRRNVIKNLDIKSKGFEVEPEITAKILKSGYKIYEVPIEVRPRGYNEGKKITWRDGFVALWTLIKYRFKD